DAGVGAGALQASADDEGRVELAFRETARDQTRRGGLAVRAGDGDAALQPHQFAEHFRARYHRYFRRARGDDFRIVARHRRGNDDDIGARDALGRVADVHRDAELREPAGIRAFARIRARHLIALVVQHFRDAAHAGPADADEMHALDPITHRAP